MAVEQVSAEILRILGLEEADEVDMESYKGFLREKLVLISMGKSNLSRDQQVVIQEEFKRIKSKPNTVKIKKTAINPKAVFGSRSSSGVKYLPPASGSLARRSLPQIKVAGENSGILENINSLMNNIWKNLSDDEKRRKKLEKETKSKLDKEEKAAKESSLEKVSKGIVKALEKTFKPVIDIFDRIVKAIQILFLGWVANKLLDWIQDPNNKRTFDAIVDFLSRNAGKLLLLFVMLNNPLVKIVRWLGKNMIKFLVRMIADLKKGKNLLKGVRGGRGAAAALTIGTTVAATGVARQMMKEGEGGDDSGKLEISTFDPEIPNYSGGGPVKTINFRGGGFPDLSKIKTKKSTAESFSPGIIDKGPSGVDKVNANVTKGEFISSVPAVNTWGVDFYEALNKLGGGTNRPTYSGGRMYATGGGLVLSNSSGSPITKFSDIQGHHAGSEGPQQKYRSSWWAPDKKRRLTQDVVLSGDGGSTSVGVPSPLSGEVVPPTGEGNHGYGPNLVVIRGSNGGSALVGHMASKKVKIGDKVTAGQIIGVQGSLGRSTGPHVHIEAEDSIIKNWVEGMLSGTYKSSVLASNERNETTDTASPSDSFKGITFASEADRKLATAYLKYITQPMGRGLDIRPTIDMVTGANPATPPPAGGADVRDGSASRGGAAPTAAAAQRQIASP